MGSVATLAELRSRHTQPRAAQWTRRATGWRASRGVLRRNFHAAFERVDTRMEPWIAGGRHTRADRQEAKIRATIGIRSARLARGTAQADVLYFVTIARAAAARIGAACRPCAHAAAASRVKADLPTALTRLAAPLRAMVIDAPLAASRPAGRCRAPHTIRARFTGGGIGFVARARSAAT